MGRAADLFELSPLDVAPVVTVRAKVQRRLPEVKIFGYTGGQVDYEGIDAPLASVIGDIFGSRRFGHRYNTEGLGVKGPMNRKKIDEVMNNPVTEVGLWAAIGERMQQIAQDEYRHSWVDSGIEFGGLPYTELFDIENKREEGRQEHGPSWVAFDIQLPGLGSTELLGKKTRWAGFILGPTGKQKLPTNEGEPEKVRLTSLMLAETDHGIGPVAVYSDIDPAHPPKKRELHFEFNPENHGAHVRGFPFDLRIATICLPQNGGLSPSGARSGAN